MKPSKRKENQNEKVNHIIGNSFFVFGATLTAFSEENDQEFFGLANMDVEMFVVNAPEEIRGQLDTLDYDVTQCTDMPLNAPAQTNVSDSLCGCVQLNFGVGQ